ncbi:MAG: NADH-quinone oxidoreductase subunit N [Cyclobacteriaceae bacterium]|nr:NADH-quinone oxidoreductase subunit N [Cyclobacteriaceae bacterium]MCH8515264.1 NADH-quinone oxidoreductase subunit N [Cyclobacteriaceae bacterium]
MNTLILCVGLGLFCLVAELINIRKLLLPILLVGLGVLFVFTLTTWGTELPPSIWGFSMETMIRFDNFSIAFSALAIFITALVFMLAIDYYKTEENHITDYASILMFTLTGALVLFSYWNMAMLYLGIEIVSISMYIMAGSRKFDTRSNEAGFKYFLMGAFASGFLLMGIAMVYGATGSFVIEEIALYANGGNLSPLFITGLVLILIAFFFKVSAVPFHFWSPDVYEGSPALVTAFMSTLVKITMFGAFYRLLSLAFPGAISEVYTILFIVATLTMSLGNLIAITQVSFKRILAYSGISHAGYMLIAIMAIPVDSSAALFYYTISYAIAGVGIFAAAIPVFFFMNNEKVEAFNGLGKKNPALAFIITILMLSMAGIPPFAGFLAKYYVFSKAVEFNLYAITIIAIINSIIGVYYYFKVILAMYTQEPDGIEVKPTTLYWTVAIACALLVIVIGILPNTLMGLMS